MISIPAVYSDIAAATFEALGFTVQFDIVPKINLESIETQFAEKLGGLMYRVETADVLDLPDKQFVKRTFELSPKERKLYREMEKELIILVESGVVTAANAMVKSIRLRQLVSGFVKTEDGIIERTGDGRNKLLKDILEDLNEPVAVFCNFREDLDSVKIIAEKLKRRYGELSGKSKDGMNADSEMESWVDMLGVQMKAGGIGVNLTRSRVGIYYSPTWNMGEYEQSISRINRPGQLRKMLFIHMAADKTVDETVYEALRSKKSVVDSVLRRLK